MTKYNPRKIEKKWQKYWKKTGLYEQYRGNKKYYVLDMFPYPSGAGLHVGHPKGFVATDVIARMKMLQGFKVLHPMGWDAFGLPAENYAIKTKTHPAKSVARNIKVYKKQLGLFGFSYDWNREVSTTDPEFYRWTQWIFLQMFKKGMAYESEEPVNWCPKCKTVLANEDLEKGDCERCGTAVIQRKIRQWVLKMTDYADRLLFDLDKPELNWEELIKEQQRNWIGRSEGIQFDLKIKDSSEKIEVYTTRIDTVYGMTYAVVAPEHLIIEKLKDRIENYKDVEKYIIAAQNKTELERTELQKEKTGLAIKGIKVINPFNNEESSLFVADYVLGFYGTGAVMAVPAHDERDLEFAKKYNLDIRKVIISKENKQTKDKQIITEAFIEDGILENSKKYSGLTSEKAREEMSRWLEKNKIGKRKVNYKMRDWVFSRQRYWGEPIPIIHCQKCGAVPVLEKDLPLILPKVKSYEPTDTGESPLANIAKWVNTKCPKCGGSGKRETNTMPQWAGSCWYYLRYIDPKNNKALIDKQKEKEWMPVDLYVGGAEHATRHLLYSRFWHKFLFDIGVVTTDEPFTRMLHVGLVNGEDGRKMSKRWGNVINPDDVISQFGADAFRIYEMFMGPFSQNIAWSTAGVSGTRRFLEKVYKLKSKVKSQKSKVQLKSQNFKIIINKTIKKVSEDIESLKFNTAISALMILANEIEKEENIPIADYRLLITLLSPFAPHLSEELWQKIGSSNSIFEEKWPVYNPKLIQDEEIELVVQVNGKLRDRIQVPTDISEEEAKKLALESEKVKGFIEDKKIMKIIFVKGRLINLVVAN
jgi:leucyl-tRNA synthetase